MVSGLVERDQLVGNLLDKIDDLDARIKILEATHPGLPGETAGKLAYYRSDDGSQRMSGDIYIDDVPLSLGRAVSLYLALPALRGFWPMSSVDSVVANRAIDVSGHGYHLTDGGGGVGVRFSCDALAPIAIFNGVAGQYLARADAGAGDWADILGTEGYVRTTERGLTLNGWFWWSALPSAVQYLVAKDDGANRQYYVVIQADNTILFRVWPGPIGVASTATINAGWNHIAGIYDQPSQTVYVALNGVVKAGAAGAAPAALVDTGAPFTIGGNGAGGDLFTGRSSMCSLQACSMYDGGSFTGVLGLWEHTRSLLGV